MKEKKAKAVCVHSCKGLCSALETAEHREQETIREYRQYLADCEFPEVREILADLISQRESALTVMREKREILMVKFDALDRINRSFT